MKKRQKEVGNIEYRRPYYTKEMFERRREKVKESSLYKELEGYQNAGLSLWLNGEPSTSYGIANYVREESDYMRDYRLDGNQKVCGIGFDRIRKDNVKGRR
ncbi:hypothetical protein DXA98_11000 [Lachnospiraceae bacterium OF09-6]|nr:hypothetical protein DXA98_11000 [Lachnospiraceae bacterium OF09-6]